MCMHTYIHTDTHRYFTHIDSHRYIQTQINMSTQRDT